MIGPILIGVYFAATTEAPPRPSSRRGRIPKRNPRPELTAVPLRLHREASTFWIILLLSWRSSEH